jgi:hypothetical protein
MGKTRSALVTGAALAAAVLAVVPAAQARSCTVRNDPRFFQFSATNTTCSKASSLGKAWAKKSSCHSSSSRATRRCTVKKYRCTSKYKSPATQSDYERVTCKRGRVTVKFSFGYG